MGTGEDYVGLKFVGTVFVDFVPLANKTVFEKHRPINHVRFSRNIIDCLFL